MDLQRQGFHRQRRPQVVGDGRRLLEVEYRHRALAEISLKFLQRNHPPGLFGEVLAVVVGLGRIANEDGNGRRHFHHRVGKGVYFVDVNAGGLRLHRKKVGARENPEEEKV